MSALFHPRRAVDPIAGHDAAEGQNLVDDFCEPEAFDLRAHRISVLVGLRELAGVVTAEVGADVDLKAFAALVVLRRCILDHFPLQFDKNEEQIYTSNSKDAASRNHVIPFSMQIMRNDK